MVTIRVPKYRIRPDRGIAFVEIFGRRIRLPGPPNSPESLAAYHRIIQEAAAAKAEKKSKPRLNADFSVIDLVVAYLDWAKVYYVRQNGRRGSEYANLRDALRPLVKLYGSNRAAEIGPLALDDVRNTMIGAKLSRSTINARIHRIRRAFRWGAEKQLIPASVVQALDTLAPLRKGKSAAVEPPPIVAVPLADVEGILPHLTTVQRDMVQVHLLTGMRSENLCLIRPADIDQSGEIWLYRPPQHKGSHLDKSLVIPLGPKCQAILQPYLDRPPEEFCFSPRESEQQRRDAQRQARKTPLTPSQIARSPSEAPKPKGRKGTRYTPGSYRRMIWYGIERANKARKLADLPEIPHWHPHQIRHTVGTAIRNKFKTEAARVFLGHSRLSVTEIYAERDLDLARQIALEMG